MPYSETISDEGRSRYRAEFWSQQQQGEESLLTNIALTLEPESYGITGSDELFQAVVDAIAAIPGVTLSTYGTKTWYDYQEVTVTPDE